MLTHSAGYRHDYLPVAAEIVKKIGLESKSFDTIVTEDCSLINNDFLKNIDKIFDFYLPYDKRKD